MADLLHRSIRVPSMVLVSALGRSAVVGPMLGPGQRTLERWLVAMGPGCLVLIFVIGCVIALRHVPADHAHQRDD